jgi:hypothetical protein
LWIDLLQGEDIFLFSEVFKLALGPTVSCLMKNGDFSPPGLKQPGMKLIIHPAVAASLGMHGAVTPVSHMPSWCGAHMMLHPSGQQLSKCFIFIIA